MFSYSCIIFITIIAFGITVLLAGLGMYLSVRIKSTPRAVMTLMMIASLFWVFLPVLCELIPGFYRYDMYDYIVAVHPLTQIFNSLDPAYYNYYHYYYFDDFLESRFFIVIDALIYASIGTAFAWRAKTIIRRNLQ